MSKTTKGSTKQAVTKVSIPVVKSNATRNKTQSTVNPKKPHDHMPPALRKLYDSLADHAPASDRYVPKNSSYTGAPDPLPYPVVPNVSPDKKQSAQVGVAVKKGSSKKPAPAFRIVRKTETS